MEKYAIIYNGNVVNIIEYESAPSNPPPGFDGEHTAVLATQGVGPGYTYANGVFTAPQPYPSWTLVDNVWTPPSSMPIDGGRYFWDESTKNWVAK